MFNRLGERVGVIFHQENAHSHLVGWLLIFSTNEIMCHSKPSIFQEREKKPFSFFFSFAFSRLRNGFLQFFVCNEINFPDNKLILMGLLHFAKLNCKEDFTRDDTLFRTFRSTRERVC